MEAIKGLDLVQRQLKRHFVFFVGALVFFLGVLASAVLLDRYVASLNSSLDGLYALKSNVIKVRSATEVARNTVRSLKEAIPQGAPQGPSAGLIFKGLDDIKAIMGAVQLTVSNVEEKGEEVSMPVVITGVAGDYPAFLTNLGRLQAMGFPFFSLNSLVVTGTTEKTGRAVASYEIRGTLATPKTGKVIH